MPFRPVDALAGVLINLDEKLTPGPIGRLRDWHYQRVEDHIASLTLPELEAEIGERQKLEPAATFIIGSFALADHAGVTALLIQHGVEPFPLALSAGPSALTICLMSVTRGIVREEELKILNDDLAERRAGRIGLAGQGRSSSSE